MLGGSFAEGHCRKFAKCRLRVGKAVKGNGFLQKNSPNIFVKFSSNIGDTRVQMFWNGVFGGNGGKCSAEIHPRCEFGSDGVNIA